MTLTRRTFCTLSAAALAPLPALAGTTQSLGGHAFGSYWRLTLPANAPASKAAGIVERQISRIDRIASPYRVDSELTRFNASNAQLWEPSGSFRTLAAEAIALAEATNGAFDPTVGPTVARYGFGPVKGGTAHWSDFELSADGLRRHRPATLDFCGLAKGYALDLMLDDLNRAGFQDALLDLGGELGAKGRHPTGRPWRVQVAGTNETLLLENAAVATSGLDAQSYVIGAKRVGHIIDPTTQRPASGALHSVSVVQKNAAAADGLATALFVMGLDRAMDYADHRRLAVLAVIQDGENRRALASKEWKG